MVHDGIFTCKRNNTVIYSYQGAPSKNEFGKKDSTERRCVNGSKFGETLTGNADGNAERSL